MEITNNEILQFCISNDIVNLDDVRNRIMNKENEKILSKHLKKHKIWFDSKANQWMTYLDDSESKRGFVLKRRKEKCQLEKLIIEHYKFQVENPTLLYIFKEWINIKYEYSEITAQTKTRYENDFKRFFFTEDKICKKSLPDITPMDLELFIKENISRYHLSKKSYNGLKIIINGIFHYARRKGLTEIVISIFFDELILSKNIFQYKPKNLDENEVYNESEIPLLKDYLLQKNSLRYLEILLVFVTGMRVGELAALKPEDIHISNSYSYIQINKTEVHFSKTDSSGKRYNVVSIQEVPKTEAGNRNIILNDFGVDVVKKILSLNPTPKELLFEDNGKRIKIRGFSGALRSTCKNLNIPFRPMHKIRKTYGTILLDNRVSETLVAQQMGHSDISTTRKYYYKNNKLQNHNVKEIENALSVI